jgi:hypothetical protein
MLDPGSFGHPDGTQIEQCTASDHLRDSRLGKSAITLGKEAISRRRNLGRTQQAIFFRLLDVLRC